MDTTSPQPQSAQGNVDPHPPLTDAQRLSIEDEHRPLPEGWIRQLDPKSSHHFYVDTLANPPRCIWVHPYEDAQWQQEHAKRLEPTPPGSGSSAAPSGTAEKEERPLPDGWIRQFDNNNNMPFYVDTRATHPRSIWVHPFDDPQWQQEQHGKHSGPPTPAPAPAPPTTERSVGASPPPPEKRAVAKEDTSRGDAMEALGGGTALTIGLALLDKLTGGSKESSPPPQQHHPVQTSAPAYQVGPGAYLPPAHTPPAYGGGRDVREEERMMEMRQQERMMEMRQQERMMDMKQQEQMMDMRQQEEYDMRHGYTERRRMFGGEYPNDPLYSEYGYQGGMMYAPPEMAYGRQRTEFGRGGFGGRGFGRGGFGGRGFGRGGRGGGGGLGLIAVSGPVVTLAGDVIDCHLCVS
ncbi:hypothetical protein FRB95_000378 [Tulasnella sp. JGI-2019a]|nr:hypothetical protein FRB95_000378 [Tulasnella sp. JGI-2019a]